VAPFGPVVLCLLAAFVKDFAEAAHMLREQILQSIRLFQVELLKHQPEVIGIRSFGVEAGANAQSLELGEVELALLPDETANQPVDPLGLPLAPPMADAR
jgi:hypothetical protein